MTPQNPGGPGGPGGIPPHLLRPSQLHAIQERVRQKYGAFGSAPAQEEDVEERVRSDNFFKPTLHIIAGVFLASLFGVIISSPTFDAPNVWSNRPRADTALIVFWAPLLYLMVARMKLARSIRIYLVLALFIESFTEAMFLEGGADGGYWNTVMWPASVAYFGTLKEFSGLPGGSLPMFTIVTAALLYRAIRGPKAIDFTPPPKFAVRALMTFLGCLVVLAAVGLAQGAPVEFAFRQSVHLLHIPLVGMLLLYTLRVPDDLAAIGTIYVTCAVARALLVIYVYFGVCVANGIVGTYRLGTPQPEWCTNHSDSVLFVTSLMILLANAFEKRTARSIWRTIGLGLLILLAVALNNRRLAFVSMGVAPLVMYLALRPSKRKRRVTTAMAILGPLLIGYVFVGSEIDSPSPLLKPAKAVVSVLDQKDLSSKSRDVENQNLIYTLKESNLGVLTKGFGHEYEEAPGNKAFNLEGYFANYRLIAHNGVLWMWSLAGVVGFTVLWMIYPLAGTAAVRAYRRAPTAVERSAALSALAAMVVCVIQIWGDQGFSSWMTLVTFSLAFAVSTRLAAQFG